MPTGFQQQQPVRNNGFCKPAAQVQHGVAKDARTIEVKEPRTFQPRPQH